MVEMLPLTLFDGEVGYLFEEYSVARAGRRFAVHVPERRVAPVHITFETGRTRACTH